MPHDVRDVPVARAHGSKDRYAGHNKDMVDEFSQRGGVVGSRVNARRERATSAFPIA